MTNNDLKTTDIRLSVSHAAKLFGISDRTIRRALGRNEIRYIVVRGRYRLNFESVLVWSQKNAHLSRKLADKGMGQWVDKWKIRNPKFSPRPPEPSASA
jgi:excisionase family DNA binding protein